jgi:hypothetical protein
VFYNTNSNRRDAFLCLNIVGPTPEGPISHFINFSGEAKNCFLEEKRRFIKKINTTEL